MVKILFIILLSFFSLQNLNYSLAQDINSPIEEKIFLAIKKQLVIHYRPDGSPIYSNFCREDKNCFEHIKYYAKHIVFYSKKYDLDPWLLTAVALHESNFNAYKVGSVGERGIFQIHPKSPWATETRFVYSKAHRRHCKDRIGHCQDEVISTAAKLIKSLLVAHKSQEKALTKYNTGKSYPIRKIYVNSVKNNMNELKNI
jgi:hypothetical protein